jgi:hypothetical protein
MRIREHCLRRELLGWLLGSEFPLVILGLMEVLEESLLRMIFGSCLPRWIYKDSSRRLCKSTSRDFLKRN